MSRPSKACGLGHLIILNDIVPINGLVVQQGCIDGFRATQMFQDKAQTAKNGLVLLKGCNTVLGHLGSSLRASREAVVRGVTPLGKDQPLPARRALRPTTSRPAEPINLGLTEHKSSVPDR